MTQDDAYNRLSEYIDGGLTVAERLDLEVYASQDSDFADAIILCRTMNRALDDQAELKPRLDFTVRVLHKCGIIDQLPAAAPSRWTETVERWAPFAAVLGALLIGARALWDTLRDVVVRFGNLVSDLTGIGAFASNPSLVMGLTIPIVAVVVVVFSLSGRWNILRQ